MVADGTRKKTLGGIYLSLVKKRVTAEQGDVLCVDFARARITTPFRVYCDAGKFAAIFLPSFGNSQSTPVEEDEEETEGFSVTDWTCDLCTCQNPFKALACEACETPHPQAGDPNFVRACGIATLSALFPGRGMKEIEAALEKSQGLVSRAADQLVHFSPELPSQRAMSGPGLGWARRDTGFRGLASELSADTRPTTSGSAVQVVDTQAAEAAALQRLIKVASQDVWCSKMAEALAMGTGQSEAEALSTLAGCCFRVEEAMEKAGLVLLPTPSKPDHHRASLGHSDGEQLRIEAAVQKRQASKAFRAASRAYKGEDHQGARREAKAGRLTKEESEHTAAEAARELFWEHNGHLRTPHTMDCHGLHSGEVAAFLGQRLAVLSALSRPQQPVTLEVIVGAGSHSTLRATLAPAVEAVLGDLGVSFKYGTRGVLFAKVPAQLRARMPG